MSIEIRAITAAEAAAAGEVTAGAYAEYLAGMDPCHLPVYTSYLDQIADLAGRLDRTTVLGAFDGGRCIGTVTLEITGRIDPSAEPPAPDEIHVRMLGVANEARGRGVGRALMEASLEFARAHGRRRITLETAEAMTVAQAMYERMGFVLTGRTTTFTGTALLLYELRLTAGAPS